jgi:hypothetical protein
MIFEGGRPMTDALAQVDLAFVVDTTGSMGAFIDAARRQMADTLRTLTAAADFTPDLRVAVVEYRDHPPQDSSFVSRAHPFAGDLARVQKVIAGLRPDGGGDGPEAVYDGVAACESLDWRPHACRVAVLIGDAPPHGTGAGGDGFRDGCPCGLTPAGVTAKLEGRGIKLYALGLTAGLRTSFTPLAQLTGGEYHDAGHGDQAVSAVRTVVAREFADLGADRRVLTAWRAHDAWTLDDLSAAVGLTPGRVAASLSRLGRRGFLTQPATRPGELTDTGRLPDRGPPIRTPDESARSLNSWRTTFGWLTGKWTRSPDGGP